MESDMMTLPEAGYKADLAQVKKMFEDAQSLTTDARRESQIDGDYYDGYQWTPEERRALRNRKQPDLVFNHVRTAINGTIGVIKQGNTDPKAYPRNPDDEESADVASKVLRFIADKARFDSLKIDVAKDYLVQGTGACIIGADADLNVTVEQIRWEEFFYDPRSRRQDLQDARYMGIAKWMYADDIAAMYPDHKGEVENMVATGAPLSPDWTFEDRPDDASTSVQWVDGKKRRLMLVELYHREGDRWYRCVFFSGGILESGESPYLNDKRLPICPIEAQSCYVDRENNRAGIVRDMRGPQDEINKRRSKALHLLSVRQVQEAQPGSGMGDADLVRSEAARPDGVLPSGWQIVPTNDLVAAQLSLLQEAKSEIERFGPNPAVLGRQGADTSGRAQLVRQQAGLTELAVIFGGIEEWELRVYQQMWNRARQFWQAPMFIRVTDDEDAMEFVGINQPIMGPPQVAMDPMTGMPTLQPTILGYRNALAEMDVDIIIDTIPDTANVQQEQFALMVELAKVGALGQNPGPLLLEASSFPNKREVIEQLEQPQDPMQAQMQQQQMQIAMQGAQAEIENVQADTAQKRSAAIKNVADAQGKLTQARMPQRPAAGVPGV